VEEIHGGKAQENDDVLFASDAVEAGQVIYRHFGCERLLNPG
jgi:hypothetical protein